MIVAKRPSAATAIPTSVTVEIPPPLGVGEGIVTGGAVVALWVVVVAGVVVVPLRPPNGELASALAQSTSVPGNASAATSARKRNDPKLMTPNITRTGP